jgi:hypothetical protein
MLIPGDDAEGRPSDPERVLVGESPGVNTTPKVGLGWKAEREVRPRISIKYCNIAADVVGPKRPHGPPPGERCRTAPLDGSIAVSLLNGPSGHASLHAGERVTLFFSMMGVLNFAHARVMLGAYLFSVSA